MPLRGKANRLGGSHAQRDMFSWTLTEVKGSEVKGSKPFRRSDNWNQSNIDWRCQFSFVTNITLTLIIP